MQAQRHWNLGTKLLLVAAPFLLLALLAIGVTLWVSWQLEGGAAAVNEAGRMRMQAYRMSLSISADQPQRVCEQAQAFARSLETLRAGDPERPLFVPWDATVRARFSTVQNLWAQYHAHWVTGAGGDMAAL